MAYFQTGYSLGHFLFEGFEVETPGAFAGAFIALVSSAVLFEGLRIIRDFFLNRFTVARKRSRALALRTRAGSVRYSRTVRNPEMGGVHNDQETHSLQAESQIHDDDYENEDRKDGQGATPYVSTAHALENSDSDIGPVGKIRYSDLILSTILHMIYISIGYILMLAVMTFNVWILVAVSVGIAIGYFVFGTWRRTDNLALNCRTLITATCSNKEGSSEKTVSTNSDSGNSLDRKTDCKVGSSSEAQVTSDVDVHCSKLLDN